MSKISDWFIRNKRTLIYILKRIGLLLITFFIITTILFLLIRSLVPPITSYGAEQEIEIARREALGYNKSVLEQLFIFYRNIITKWDFGTSWKIAYLSNANDLFISSLPYTVLVNLYAVILIIPCGIGMGIFQALHKRKIVDTIISVAVMILISLPSFIIALLLQYILGYKAGLPLTTYSLYDAGGSFFSFPMIVSQIMPVLALFIPSFAALSRFTRAEMIEALHSENVNFARSVGVPEKKIIFHYAFKNALVPLLPMIIGLITGIFAGSIVIEKVFSIPGTGLLMINSIEKLDYDVFMVCAMFYTFIGLLTGLIIDITYTLVDPRIRMGGGRHYGR